MYLSTIRSFMSININIIFTFMHISRFILVLKSSSFTFFIWIFTHSITFLHRRFVYIHTFFHRQIMCSCRLATCLYHIQQTSYERRLHHSHVAPSVPIWAEFAPILGKIYLQPIWAATPVLSRSAIVYRHILLGENSLNLIRTRAHEKNLARFFSRQVIICTVYCWEKCKKL